MVATDLAGRGLDFSHVSHVINYDYPCGLETYTHRTGRTGRMGRSGIAMTFVTDQELGDLKSLLTMNRIDPVWHGNIPNLQTIASQKGRGNARHFFKKRPKKAAANETRAVRRSQFMRGDEWQRPLMKSA
jgi:superfamily II DNA/RNA helicase